jgi:hypothetical protein
MDTQPKPKHKQRSVFAFGGNIPSKYMTTKQEYGNKIFENN